MKLAIFVAVLVLSATSAFAQAVPTPVTPGQTFTLAWDYNPPVGAGAVDTIRVELNGGQVGADLGPTVRQTTITAPAICGNNSLRVANVNTGGVVWSDVLTFTVTGCPPGKPTNLRLIFTQVGAANQNGTVPFVLSVEQVDTPGVEVLIKPLDSAVVR